MALKGDFAKSVFFEGAKIMQKRGLKEAPGFQGYRQYYIPTREIHGQNVFHAIADTLALELCGVRMLTPFEARKQEPLGTWTQGFMRRFGIVVYNNKGPNSDIGSALIEKISKLNLQLPYVLTFSDLDIISSNNSYGLGLVLKNNGIYGLYGQEARDFLSFEINNCASSGLHGISRDEHGLWDAFGPQLDYSKNNIRLDRVCGKHQVVEHIEELSSKRDAYVHT